MSKYPIQKVTSTITIVNGQGSANAADLPAVLNGRLRAIYVNAPVLTSTNTLTLAVVGPATSFTLFSKASIPQNAKTTILSDSSFAGGNSPLNIPLSGACGLQLTSSGTEGADRVITVILLIDRGA